MAPITMSWNAHDSALLDPFTPVGYTTGGIPVWPAQGGRSGGGIDFVVDDRDDDTDPFDDEDDDSDEVDDEGYADERGDDEDDEPRSRQQRRRQRDDEGDADADADGDDDWEPPTREQWAKMEEAQRRNNGELMKRRLAAKTLKRLNIDEESDLDAWLIERGIDPENGGRLAGYDDGDPGDDNADDLLDADGDPRKARTQQQVIQDLKRAESRGAAKAESRYKPAVAQYAATAALREAGWRGENTALGLRLLDLDKLDIDFQDGELIIFGLDDQIEQIKKDLPERFTAGRPAKDTGSTTAQRRTGGRTARGGAAAVDGGERRKPAPRKRGWMDQLDQRLTRGY